MAEKKQQTQMYVLIGLVVVAALVWYEMSAKTPASSGFSQLSGTYTPINAQDFGTVFDKLKSTEGTEYKTSGRNIFAMTAVPADAEPVKKEPPKVVPVGPQLPPPPPPAQLAWKFFGYGNLPSGGPRQAFLLDGEEVRIVAEGETVLNHIRITKIGNDKIEFEDTNTHQTGSNQLEAMPGPTA
ncbi:MAG TPA: hypothetical protein VGF61_15790 [Candidatus Acidoferrum sp.]|jgi:hypothetical protein